jgi:Flp pilus assembly protein TadG
MSRMDDEGRARRRVRRLATDRKGIAAVEFAIISSLFTIFLLGAFDCAQAVLQTLALRQAVAAGAQYALQFPTTSNYPTDIENVITNAIPANFRGTATVAAPVLTYACSDSSGNVTATNSASCSSGTLEKMMTLSVSRPFTGLLLTALGQTSATSVLRYQ